MDRDKYTFWAQGPWSVERFIHSHEGLACLFTYNTLLKTCAKTDKLDQCFEAREFMSKVSVSAIQVPYSTLLIWKELATCTKSWRLTVSCADHVPLNEVFFSLLIKTKCDAGRVETILDLLETLNDMGLKSDEIVFNNLLSASVKSSDVILERHIFFEMIQTDVRVSSTSF